MDRTTLAHFRAIAEACRRVGSANDLDDRGFPDDARVLREDAQRAIAAALRAASSDDRDRLASLFGPDLPARCDQYGWGFVHDYLEWLCARDPELPVAAQPPRHLQPFPGVEPPAGHVRVHGAHVRRDLQAASGQLVVEQEVVLGGARRELAHQVPHVEADAARLGAERLARVDADAHRRAFSRAAGS